MLNKDDTLTKLWATYGNYEHGGTYIFYHVIEMAFNMYGYKFAGIPDMYEQLLDQGWEFEAIVATLEDRIDEYPELLEIINDQIDHFRGRHDGALKRLGF